MVPSIANFKSDKFALTENDRNRKVETKAKKLNWLTTASIGAVHNLRLQIEVGGWSAKCKQM